MQSTNRISLITVILLSIVLLQYRAVKSDLFGGSELKVTTWDALAYYMYLPAVFIYNDIEKMEWLSGIDEKYRVTGGSVYQLRDLENGNRIVKYFSGLSILQAPFFLSAHFYAGLRGYAQDGFSKPYQYAIAFSALFYAILGLFTLRMVLIHYFNDVVVSLSMIVMVLGTNFIQYVSIDGAMTHAYLFFLYCCVLFTTMKWYETPKKRWAILTGFIVGLATLCRPTDFIMVLIPIFWIMPNNLLPSKRTIIKKYWVHIILAIVFGLIATSPQLIYWKIVTGDWIYNLGSKWYFLNPFFRVLFGWTNGWFIYTPLVLLFIVGMFFIRDYPFRKSVIIFTIINIWIIISWSDWRYGATYSTRALVQSYAVLMLPLCAFIEKLNEKKIKYLMYPLFGFLIYLNIFQLDQYFNNILHYRDMNRAYYGAIFLNKNPNPIDFSLLDSNLIPSDNELHEFNLISSSDKEIALVAEVNQKVILFDSTIYLNNKSWLKFEAEVLAKFGYGNSYIYCKISGSNGIKTNRVRIYRPLSYPNEFNDYAFFTPVDNQGKYRITYYIQSTSNFIGKVKKNRIELWVP